jgi:hypothetical protein
MERPEHDCSLAHYELIISKNSFFFHAPYRSLAEVVRERLVAVPGGPWLFQLRNASQRQLPKPSFWYLRELC